MPQYKMVVLSNPMPGLGQECEDWYQTTHLQDMVALQGFTSAQRFRLVQPMEEKHPYQYLSVYEIDTDDLNDTLAALVSAATSGTLKVSESLDAANAYAVIYEACGDPVYSFGKDRRVE